MGMIRLDNIGEYRENNRIEAKKAAGGLPHSLWETYSAFANTFGGIILLGVEELSDHTLRVSGIADAQGMAEEFWQIVRNKKYVSENILDRDHVRIQESDGKDIIAIHVPRAERRVKPVYLGEDPYRGSYRRCGEGDYHCTADEVRNMLRNRESSRDGRVLPMAAPGVLDVETAARYKEKFSQAHPGHEWLALPLLPFLERLGAVKQSGAGWSPTAAGLLMFGREQEIVRAFPGYFLDYRERREGGHIWSDRILSGTDDWSGNLCDFYFCVCDRITTAITLPLEHVPSGRTPMREAIREAVANAVIHADYDGGNGLVIERDREGVTITNPGDLRVNPDDAGLDGVSDHRNAALARMFHLVGVGRGTGGGLHTIQTVWEQYRLGKPRLREQFNPDTVTLRLTIETNFTDMAKARLAVLNFLTDHVEGDEAALAKSLGVSEERVKEVLRGLLAQEAIVPGSRGGYQLKR